MALSRSEIIKWFVENNDVDFLPSGFKISSAVWRWVTFDGRTPHLMNEIDLSTITAGDIARARLDAMVDAKRDNHSGDAEPNKPDMVNHPPHYQSDNGIECIDAIRAALGREGFIAYCRGNAMKYVWREKVNAAEDLRKAAWYLERAASELEQRNEQN